MLRKRRQERRDDLEIQILIVMVAVGATLQDADLVVQALDHPEADLVLRMAVRDDTLPMPLDHVGKALEGLEALPLQTISPEDEEGASPDGILVVPELAEGLLEQ